MELCALVRWDRYFASFARVDVKQRLCMLTYCSVRLRTCHAVGLFLLKTPWEPFLHIVILNQSILKVACHCVFQQDTGPKTTQKCFARLKIKWKFFSVRLCCCRKIYTFMLHLVSNFFWWALQAFRIICWKNVIRDSVFYVIKIEGDIFKVESYFV